MVETEARWVRVERCGEGGARDNPAYVNQHWRGLPSPSSRDDKAMVCREMQKGLTEMLGLVCLQMRGTQKVDGGREMV